MLLFNVTPVPLSVEGWKLVVKNNNSLQLSGTIKAGDTLSIKLPGNNVQLANKGGVINLLDAMGKLIDSVAYTKERVKRQGWSIIF